MSLFAEIQSAATEAQNILAQLQGMSAGGTNTLLATGATCIGVYGHPQPQEVPLPGGGYRKRTVVPLTITRDQLSSPPAPRSKIVRTDITPHIAYTIDFVDTQDALNYHFDLVNFSD